jgi:predicted nucleotidyltransferase
MPTIRKALSVLSGRTRITGAFLFGSYAEGNPGPYSDIDLAVFAEGAERWGMFERADLASFVQSQAGDRIEVHFFPAKELGNAEPASFAQFVQKHGVRIDLNPGS